MAVISRNHREYTILSCFRWLILHFTHTESELLIIDVNAIGAHIYSIKRSQSRRAGTKINWTATLVNWVMSFRTGNATSAQTIVFALLTAEHLSHFRSVCYGNRSSVFQKINLEWKKVLHCARWPRRRMANAVILGHFASNCGSKEMPMKTLASDLAQHTWSKWIPSHRKPRQIPDDVYTKLDGEQWIH